MRGEVKLKILILLLSPISVFYVAFTSLFIDIIHNFSVEWVISLLNKNLLFSLYISLISTLLSILIGSFLFYLYPVNNMVLAKIFRLTVFAPHIAFAYLIYLLFSPTGLLSRLFFPYAESIILVNDPYGIGIIIHYVLKEIPFVFLYLLSVNSLNDYKLLNISRDLGASVWETYYRVFFPLKKSSIKVVFILIFSYTLSSYEAPFFLGHYSNQFTSVEIMNNFNSLSIDENSFAQVQAIFLFFINITVGLIVLIRKGKK